MPPSEEATHPCVAEVTAVEECRMQRGGCRGEAERRWLLGAAGCREAASSGGIIVGADGLGGLSAPAALMTGKCISAGRRISVALTKFAMKLHISRKIVYSSLMITKLFVICEMYSF